MEAPRDWGKRFFRRGIFHPGESSHLAAAPREAAFAFKALGLKRGDSLLDVCCGVGRHSVRFARRGLDVTGLDATPAYLQEARRLKSAKGALRFIQGDMRRIPFRNAFDAAVNLWTSFGYFHAFRDDLRVLRGVARALKPGGRFLIDIVDADFLREHASPRHWAKREGGGFRLEEFAMREGRDPGHTNTWTILRPGAKPRTAAFFVRSYDRERLSGALRRAGLEPLRFWGSLRGDPHRRGESPRLVVLSRKPN